MEEHMDRDEVRRIYGPLLDRGTVRGITDVVARNPAAWIETDILIGALRDNAREPIPDAFIDYLMRRLEGEVRKQRGRGRTAQSSTVALRNLLISSRFERYERWLTARKTRSGLKGWSAVRTAEWWQGPPSERAARMAQRRSGLNVSWRRIQDIAYAQRR
ncbi:MAG: hypothetical protein C0456_18750 [Hyphomonas sp.]|nr:hypothetical protein [Hyphomonas sp.]